MSLTFADLFCGAGGSITGFVEAGLQLVLGANHSARAIETVATNYPAADFLQCDINALDKRRLPHTDILWASVICTEMSPAGGNRKRHGQRQLDLEQHGHIPADVYERTRACALDVVQATEIHRYLAVVVENVVEFARDWELYDWWIEGMKTLGYNIQVVNASAAHVYGENNPPAPQWRDRIFIVFTRKGIRLPDLNLRPPAWCDQCDNLVDGVQRFKRLDRRMVGKYGQQYLYHCPVDNSVVEPLVLPAITAIDVNDVGERIGDRKKPLAANTMARIEWGVRNLAEPVIVAAAGNTYEHGNYKRAWPATRSPLTARQATGCDAVAGLPLMVNTNHDDTRVYPADAAPLPVRSTKIGDGVATVPFYVKNHGDLSEVPHCSYPCDTEPLSGVTTKVSHGLTHVPFVVVNRSNGHARPVNDPLAAVTTGNNQLLTSVPFVFQNAYGQHNGRSFPVAEAPLHTVTATHGDAMVNVPFITMLRNNQMATRIDEPLNTVATYCHHWLTTPPGSHLPTIDGRALVIPYRRGKAKRITEPLHTIATKAGEALVVPRVDILDCYYRMLKPREHLRAQRTPETYVVTGNIGEQTMQAGNMVPVNVAHWIGKALIAALDAA